jgi:predicted outer membrane protein
VWQKVLLIGCLFEGAALAAPSEPEIVDAMITQLAGEFERAQAAAAGATNPLVSQFASQLIADNSALIDEVETIAAELQINPSRGDVGEVIAGNAAHVLAAISYAPPGDPFDLVYMCGEIRMHAAWILSIENELGASTPELRLELARLLAIARARLAAAQMVVLTPPGGQPPPTQTTPGSIAPPAASICLFYGGWGPLNDIK